MGQPRAPRAAGSPAPTASRSAKAVAGRWSAPVAASTRASAAARAGRPDADAAIDEIERRAAAKAARMAMRTDVADDPPEAEPGQTDEKGGERPGAAPSDGQSVSQKRTMRARPNRALDRAPSRRFAASLAARPASPTGSFIGAPPFAIARIREPSNLLPPKRVVPGKRGKSKAGAGSRFREPGRDPVHADQLVIGLARADDRPFAALDHDLGQRAAGCCRCEAWTAP